MKEKLYDVVCPNCKTEMKVKKSLGHFMGMCDAGVCKCISCSEMFRLIYEETSDTMKSEIWK